MNEIDAYIQQFPETVQHILKRMREIIRKNAPEAEEGMAYAMPGYKTNKKAIGLFCRFQKPHRLLCDPFRT